MVKKSQKPEYQGPALIEDQISQIIKPLFVKKRKNSFFIINNLTNNWQKIIGEKFHQFCAPKEVKFEKNQKNNGTLYIKAYNASIAFYLEANCNSILEKIAMIYGYKIFKEIKIHQELNDPLEKSNEKKIHQIDQKEEQKIISGVSHINDEALRHTLINLGKEILKNKKTKID